jgi:hypothetical protein
MTRDTATQIQLGRPKAVFASFYRPISTMYPSASPRGTRHTPDTHGNDTGGRVRTRLITDSVIVSPALSTFVLVYNADHTHRFSRSECTQHFGGVDNRKNQLAVGAIICR